MVRPIEDNFAPYAPVKAILDVIKRYREKGLPDPLSYTVLEQVGVSPTMAGPTLKTLVFLRLVDEGGNHTEAFDRLKRASTEEYPEILAEIIRKAYLHVFTIVDPAQDGDIAIADAFRRYDPANQRKKMIRLFTGLCEEARIVKPREKKRGVSVQKPKPKPRVSLFGSTHRNQMRGDVKKEETNDSNQGDTAIDYRLISAVIQQLPRSRCWTSEKRKRWLDAMTSAVDLVVDVSNDSNKVEDNN